MPKTVPVPFPNKIEISRSYYHKERLLLIQYHSQRMREIRLLKVLLSLYKQWYLQFLLLQGIFFVLDCLFFKR